MLSPTFQLDYVTERNGKQFIVRLYQCQSSGLSIASKLTDFIIPEMDFECFVNPADQLGMIYFPEVS